ncbi:hypothetical protein I5U56_06330 [Stenotrophomonas maltophilia]|nr:hypothetical protein [Stenotrophomonas maltophilia]
MENKRRYVPIRFIDSQGRNVADPSSIDQTNCLPVISVRVIAPGSPDNIGTACLALLDTGCDFMHVAPDVLDPVAGRRVRDVSTSGVTGGLDTAAFDCTLLIPINDGNLVPVETDAIRSPGISGRAYQLLVGRSLLRHGRLVMDYKDKIFRFYIE